MNVTESERNLLVNALGVAAIQYDSDARKLHYDRKLAEQFQRQAHEARELAAKIETADL